MEGVCALFLALCVCHVQCLSSAHTESGALEIKEYCEDDYFFKPQCGESQVILIKHARYGRMHEKRCIPDAQGFLGCSMDARDILGKKCSGRRSCEVLITSIPPRSNPPCGKGLRGYLEAAYECMDVTYPPRGYCRTGEVAEIRHQGGYLSSLVARETGCGSSLSPWWISALPGQQLRFHLLVFSEDSNIRQQTVYAVFKEKPTSSNLPISSKVSELTTIGNRVEVTIMIEDVEGRDMDNFLIGFEVLGCPDVTPPVNGWMKRNGDTVLMGCNGTQSSGRKNEWALQCEVNKWKGNTQTCPAIQHGERDPLAAAAKSKPEWNFLTESNALIITAGVGIAILIGICLLILGLVYICRMQRARRPSGRPDNGLRKRAHQTECSRANEQFIHGHEQDDYYCPAGREHNRHWDETPGRHGMYPAKHGPSAADMPLPPPPYSPSRPLSSASTNRWSKSGAEHVYERPTFVIPPSDQAAEGDTHSMSTSYHRADEQQCGECDHMNTL